MHASVPIDDAGRRIVAHARGAHRMRESPRVPVRLAPLPPAAERAADGIGVGAHDVERRTIPLAQPHVEARHRTIQAHGVLRARLDRSEELQLDEAPLLDGLLGEAGAEVAQHHGVPRGAPCGRNPQSRRRICATRRRGQLLVQH